jgi:hypothetical protein
MNAAFFHQVQTILATERIDAYRMDGVPPDTTLARYLWNMALCESLYPPLQMAEIALRNSLHRGLSDHFKRENWYDLVINLSPGQRDQIHSAREKLGKEKKPLTPGRMVAELHFGFWTGFLNKRQAGTGLGHALASTAFPHAPRADRDLRKLDARWNNIRILRNRVFHHERIIHWTDLEAQHNAILEVIGWTSPELRQMAEALDRFTSIRKDGLQPWLNKIHHHWPKP